MWRSEVSALRWADVVDSTDRDGVLVTVRRSKTNQEGEVNDVRFVKDGVARALRMLRAAMNPEPGDRVVPLSAQMIGLRFTATAVAAGVESRVTAHSGRVGLASELTSRGASTTDVMLAGNWKTSRMVAHYSAGATAERGAVARYTTPRLRHLAGRREGVTPGTCARLPKGMNSEDGSPSAVDHHAAVSRDRGFENTTYILLFAKPSTFAGGCSVIDGADRVRQSRIRQVEPMGFQHELNAISRHGTSASRPTLECNVDCATVLSDGRRRRPEINWQNRWYEVKLRITRKE